MSGVEVDQSQECVGVAAVLSVLWFRAAAEEHDAVHLSQPASSARDQESGEPGRRKF